MIGYYAFFGPDIMGAIGPLSLAEAGRYFDMGITVKMCKETLTGLKPCYTVHDRSVLG